MSLIRRTTRHCRQLVVLSLAAHAAMCLGQTPQSAADLDAAFKTRIQAFLSAPDSETREAAFHSLAAIDSAELIPRLVRFSANADNTREGMVAAAVIERLRLPQTAVIAALAPHLDSEDTAFSNSLRGILRSYEGREGGRPPDFTIYRQMIEQRVRADQPLPEALVRYLYESDPGAALLLMMRAHGVREPDQIKIILWAEHVVADALWRQRYGFLDDDAEDPAAARELGKLARHPQWWARLYVAEIMRQEPEFRRMAIVNRLDKDSHPFVRQTVALGDD